MRNRIKTQKQRLLLRLISKYIFNCGKQSKGHKDIIAVLDGPCILNCMTKKTSVSLLGREHSKEHHRPLFTPLQHVPSIMLFILMVNKIGEQKTCALIVPQQDSFTCGEDLFIFSHVPAFLLSPGPANYHIVTGCWISLHLNVVHTEMALHPKPGIRRKKKYLKTLHFYILTDFMHPCQQRWDYYCFCLYTTSLSN